MVRQQTRTVSHSQPPPLPATTGVEDAASQRVVRGWEWWAMPGARSADGRGSGMPHIPAGICLLCAGLLLVPLAAAQETAPPASPPNATSPASLPSDTAQAANQASEPSDQLQLLERPFERPQQLLRLLDVGPSEFDAFVDGKPITPVDEEALQKILLRMPQIEPDDIFHWLHRSVPWDQLKTAPAKYRGEFFLVEGRARRVERIALRPRLASLFGYNHYYQVHIELPSPSRSGPPVCSVLVCSRVIPTAWQKLQQLDKRCRVRGMFLKRAADASNLPQLLFAAPDIAWLPDHVEPELEIGPSAVLLGHLGMDYALFDAVRSRNGLPIGASERECFYSLLRTAHQATPAQLAKSSTPLDLGSLLQDPTRASGQLLSVQGTVQRIVSVLVNEDDIRERFGIDHYYQLDALVSVGDRPIAVRGGKQGEAGPVYRDTFPVTCCCLSLPASWQPLVGQTNVNEEARLTGFFFRLWAYPNSYVTSFDQRQRQLSPMLMLHEPIPLNMPADAHRTTVPWIGVGFLVLLALIWGFALRLSRSDRHRSAVLQQRFGRRDDADFEPPEQTPP